MYNIFLSFSKLSSLLIDGTIDQGTLDAGLYHFGCQRAHVMDPILNWTVGWGQDASCSELIAAAIRKGVDPKPLVTQLQASLLKAEAEGRCNWDKQSNALIDMLVRNNVATESAIKESLAQAASDTIWGFATNYPSTRNSLAKITNLRCVW